MELLRARIDALSSYPQILVGVPDGTHNI